MKLSRLNTKMRYNSSINSRMLLKTRILFFIIGLFIIMLLVLFIKYKLPLIILLILIIPFSIFVQYWKIKNNYYMY
jgi:hypothetical protein